MSEYIAPSTPLTGVKLNFMENRARDILLRILKGIKRGTLEIEEGEKVFTFGNPDGPINLKAKITVKSPRFYPRILFDGDVGAGEAYMEGLWQSGSLTDVIRIFALNSDILDNMNRGIFRITAPLRKFFHGLNRNTRRGSKKNIHAHYDLGNDFFFLFLDETKTYSCGIFESPNDTLMQASLNKYESICQNLGLKENDEVIEIGTGWGGFALYAAEKYGCRVTTTTISEQQYNYVKELIKERNLEKKINLLFKDYRDLEGSFDKLVSIEMIEAIGYQYMNRFFKKCSDLLKEDGKMALQVITMLDSRFNAHKDSVDFIKKYIFPGSCVLSIASIADSIAEVTDFRIVGLRDIGLHYADTLRTWRENLNKNSKALRQMGYPEEFERMWEYYFSYCEGAFRERYISDAQMFMAKPMNRD